MPRGYRQISRVAQPVEKKKKWEYAPPSKQLGERALSAFRAHEKEIIAKYNKGMSGNSLSRWLLEHRGVDLSISRLQVFLDVLHKEGKVVKRTQKPRRKGKKVK